MFIFQIAQLPNAGVGGPPLPNAGVGGPPLPNAGQNNLPNAGADPFIPAQVPGQFPLPGGITAQELANQLRISLQLYGRRSGLGTLPAAERMNLLPNTVDELLAQHPHLANEAPITSLLTTHQTQFTNLQTDLTNRAITLGEIFNNPHYSANININDQFVFNGPGATSRPVHEVVGGLSTQISTLIGRYRAVLGTNLTDNEVLLKLANQDPQAQAHLAANPIDLNPQETALLADLTRIALANQGRDGANPTDYGNNYLNGLARQVIIGRSLSVIYTEHRTRAGANYLLSDPDLRRISNTVYTNPRVVELGIRETPFERDTSRHEETSLIRTPFEVASAFRLCNHLRTIRTARTLYNAYQIARINGHGISIATGRACQALRVASRAASVARGPVGLLGRWAGPIGGVLALGDCAWDIATAFRTGRSEDIRAAAINTGLTVGLGVACAILLPGVGFFVGAAVGNLLANVINGRFANFFGTAVRAIGRFGRTVVNAISTPIRAVGRAIGRFFGF